MSDIGCLIYGKFLIRHPTSDISNKKGEETTRLFTSR